MLKTFSIGGVHPHENKLSAHQPIVQAEIPAKAVILLSQHIGAPAKALVKKVCQRKGRKNRHYRRCQRIRQTGCIH